MAEMVEAVFEVVTLRWAAGRAVERQDAAMGATRRAAAVPVAGAIDVARTETGRRESTGGAGGAFWVQDPEMVAIQGETERQSRPEGLGATRKAGNQAADAQSPGLAAPGASASAQAVSEMPGNGATAVDRGELEVASPGSGGPSGGPSPAPAPRPVRLLGRLGKLVEAGVDPAGALPLEARKPPWLRANAHMGTEFRSLRKTVRGLGLVTVCEEAGCPNIFECWADGTATFMINGDRCTRACGFCQVDTAKPLPLDPDEPERVAEAVARLGLAHAVVTCVARDDLADGGASGFAGTIDAIRRRCPGTAVEVLISDCKGDPASLDRIFERRPDVLNHNVETVPRLQRAVRPSASYARSLAVLARARDAGLTTKSGLMLGLGETEDEVVGVLADLQAIGVGIVTIGQYLRPSVKHLPVARWWAPEDFARIAEVGRSLGLPQVVSSPLTRSSYHARQAAAGAGAGAGAATGTGASLDMSTGLGWAAARTGEVGVGAPAARRLVADVAARDVAARDVADGGAA